MSGSEGSLDDFGDLGALRERAKELRCLYRVVAVLGQEDRTLDRVVRDLLEAIPPGWQFPEITVARLTLGGRRWEGPGFRETPWVLTQEVVARGERRGTLEVGYLEARPVQDVGPFLEEERQLLATVAGQLGQFLSGRDREEGLESPSVEPGPSGGSAQVILDFLARTDARLTRWLTTKMINHLRWQGVSEVEAFLPGDDLLDPELSAGSNRPIASEDGGRRLPTREVFELASRHCSGEEILAELRAWITQDKARFLVTTVEDQGASLGDTVAALERFASLGVDEADLPRGIQTMLRVGLLRRFFSDEIGFVNAARGVSRVSDFHELSERLVHPLRSHGKLGGKSAGVFVARRLLAAVGEAGGRLGKIRVPRTWYLASDGVLAFVRHNHLEDVYDRKYLDLEEVRRQYRHVVQVFRSSEFPPELRAGLARALEELGRRPLVVRSSSLLEDRTGAAFSGKYKSLFLANQGSREQRLRALQSAVAEVYASIFGPDPIQYRAERNLLDVHEEMGIMIQEVVGTRVGGRYFLPTFSGVALSNNDLRWSPRIRRSDGLVRLVPGLGTRAVDRLSDDFPVLLSPGQPGLRVTGSPEEVLRYAPRKVDLIDLERDTFETVPLSGLVREAGNQIPGLREVVSLVEEGQIRSPGALADLEQAEAVVTFEGLASGTPFLQDMRRLLDILSEGLGKPVDVEFASDGSHLHLLQCRPQSYGPEDEPVRVPGDLRREDVLFSAHRYVSNGRVPDLTHVVYVDPARYGALTDPARMKAVGRLIGRLNAALPARRFVLMGPGRWGSRGDIRLGVPVTYADINHAALLVEVARQEGDYLPDLSFGTHFFHDLVEAGIRYLPLYPDEPGVRFDVDFLLGGRNRLGEWVPDAGELEEVVRVVDVRAERGGRVLRVFMDGEADLAVGAFVPGTVGG